MDNDKKPTSRRSNKYSRHTVSTAIHGTSRTAASPSSSHDISRRRFVNEAEDDVGASPPTATRRSNTTSVADGVTPVAFSGVASTPSGAPGSSILDADSGQQDGDLESQMTWRGNNERIPTMTADEEHAHDLQSQDMRRKPRQPTNRCTADTSGSDDDMITLVDTSTAAVPREERNQAAQQEVASSQDQGPVPGAFAVRQGTVEQRTLSVIPHDDDLVTHISQPEHQAGTCLPERPVVPEVPIAAEVAPENRDAEERINILENRLEEVERQADQQEQERQQEQQRQHAIATAEVVRTNSPDTNVGGQEPADVTQTDLDASQPRKKLWQRPIIFWVLCAVALVGIIVGVAVPIASHGGSDENPTPFPTPVPTGPTSPSLPNGPWEQLGQDLNGKGPEDYAGWSVALSKDASVVALGAPECRFNACSSTPPGYVVVYGLGTLSQSRTQMGQELVGQANGERFGTSVSLNGVGSIISVGSPEYDGVAGESSGRVQVLEYNSGTTQWELLGDPIEGESSNDGFGISVSLSESGLILAVGAWFADTATGIDSGSVRLFQFNRDAQAWLQLGQTLLGQADFDQFGVSVSLSSSGMIVGIGADEGGNNNQGQVSVFQYNSVSSSWIPMGGPTNGQSLDVEFGFSVSLDDSGLILAAGAYLSDIGEANSGSVTVLEFDNSTLSWTRRGQTLVSQASNELFGFSVSLSRDGNVLAAGSTRNDGNGLTNSGNVRIFEYDKTNTREWIQVGSDIQGLAAGDQSGWSVSLSGNGTVIVIGSLNNDNGGTDSGHARVFTLN